MLLAVVAMVTLAVAAMRFGADTRGVGERI